MSPTDRPATQTVTDEEVSAALGGADDPPPPRPASPPTIVERPTPVPAAPPTTADLPPARPTVRWRPTRRPPVAALTVCDDGHPDGQTIPIRAGRFVIGRTDGDLALPHDELVSTRHAEITRQQVGGLARWVVTDLNSTNGLFVRVARTALADRSELLVGGGHYRFDAADGEPAADQAGRSRPGRGWGADPAAGGRPPTLTELTPGGVGTRVALTRPEYWIGTDPGCAVCRPGDPFCEPRQCRVYRRPRGGWYADHPKTLNGLWFRVPRIVAERTVQFQIGEQRFRLRV